jgi:hypothetical protein
MQPREVFVGQENFYEERLLNLFRIDHVRDLSALHPSIQLCILQQHSCYDCSITQIEELITEIDSSNIPFYFLFVTNDELTPRQLNLNNKFMIPKENCIVVSNVIGKNLGLNFSSLVTVTIEHGRLTNHKVLGSGK